MIDDKNIVRNYYRYEIHDDSIADALRFTGSEVSRDYIFFHTIV